MELFSDVVPITIENFRALCTSKKGKAPNRKPLHCKGSSFHEVIAGQFCVGSSCSGDENFKEKHKGFGVLFMFTGEERDNNCSRRMVCCVGGVVERLDVVLAIENVGWSYGQVLKPALIADCSQL
ncbi:hypothetical protein AMTRI_Chr12g235720 [Amborella trichopoda]